MDGEKKDKKSVNSKLKVGGFRPVCLLQVSPFPRLEVVCINYGLVGMRLESVCCIVGYLNGSVSSFSGLDGF